MDTGWYRIAQANEYWGKAGSGMLYVCEADKTILLVHRSGDVLDPATWGIPGGAVAGTEGIHAADEIEHEHDEDASRSSAEKESREEIGVSVKTVKDIGQTVYQDSGFRYTTYVAAVTPQEKQRISRSIRLNWENDDWGWFLVDRLPSPLHHGLTYSLSQLGWNSDVFAPSV
jgi:8-oxo-dGTP pyrophosphatase MutT (NUDIX family)